MGHPKVMTLMKRSEGHGYMKEPPSRSSMWRVGFETPENYDDNGVRCAINAPDCRVCGDKDNEAGGKYANGIIVRNYVEAQEIDIFVNLTFTHLGYFEIHLCPHNDPSTPVTEDCLLEHTLMLEDGSTRFYIDPMTVGGPWQLIKFKVILPENVTCTQCVLRWYYRVGNNWGVDPDTGISGLGYGPQERFFACADVSISAASSSASTTSTTRSTPGEPATPPTAREPATPPTTKEPATIPTTREPVTIPTTREPATPPTTREPATHQQQENLQHHQQQENLQQHQQQENLQKYQQQENLQHHQQQENLQHHQQKENLQQHQQQECLLEEKQPVVLSIIGKETGC